MNSLFTEKQHDVVSEAIWHTFKHYTMPLPSNNGNTTALDFLQQLEFIAKNNQAARVLYCLMPTRLSNTEVNKLKSSSSDEEAKHKVVELISNKLETYFSNLPVIAFKGIDDSTASEIEAAEFRTSLLDWTKIRGVGTKNSLLSESTQKIVAAFAQSLATFNAQQQQLQHSRC